MPSKTFLNLSKDKQKMLIEAAEREFSRIDFFSSSINQIIQDASIKFVSGALDESGFLAEVERWRTTGGDKVAQEYMESYNTIHGE